MRYIVTPIPSQYPLEDIFRRGAMPPCCFASCSLTSALLPAGDESAMNLEGLGVSFSTYLLFSAAFLRVGSELRRECGFSVNRARTSCIGPMGLVCGGAIIRTGRIICTEVRGSEHPYGSGLGLCELRRTP